MANRGFEWRAVCCVTWRCSHGRSFQTFRRSVLSPFSWSKTKPRKKLARIKQQAMKTSKAALKDSSVRDNSRGSLRWKSMMNNYNNILCKILNILGRFSRAIFIRTAPQEICSERHKVMYLCEPKNMYTLNSSNHCKYQKVFLWNCSADFSAWIG
jgi:hypothetical protein